MKSAEWIASKMWHVLLKNCCQSVMKTRWVFSGFYHLFERGTENRFWSAPAFCIRKTCRYLKRFRIIRLYQLQHSDIFRYLIIMFYLDARSLNHFWSGLCLSYLTHFKSLSYFYTPLRTSENLFLGYRNAISAQNGLIMAPRFVIIIPLIIILPTINMLFLNFTTFLYALYPRSVCSSKPPCCFNEIYLY